MDRVRTALVGCGKVGQIHTQALAALPESKFVAACDVASQRATSLAARFGAKAFSSVAQMLDECGIQALFCRHASSAPCRATDRGGQGRRARSGRKTTGDQLERLRRDARRGTAKRNLVRCH
jgi:threonine dehydrogenase-like Zn-dependent dehydrogenase